MASWMVQRVEKYLSSPFTREEYCKSLSTFATGVTIITTWEKNRQPTGVTINSFTSVSLDPFLILFCLRTSSYTYKRFERCFTSKDCFAVNVLSAEQKHLSDLFATTEPTPDFSNVCEFEYKDSEVPILKNCCATLICQTTNLIPGGDHDIILGKVLKVGYDLKKEPLIYHRSHYKLLIP